MIITIRTYVNYLSIETAISDATLQQITKTDELAFTQNFLVSYENSEYAGYFLSHENNMLLPGEYIVKFEEMYEKQAPTTWAILPYANYEENAISTPQQSWNMFLHDKFYKK